MMTLEVPFDLSHCKKQSFVRVSVRCWVAKKFWKGATGRRRRGLPKEPINRRNEKIIWKREVEGDNSTELKARYKAPER
jgi:hypothetical protein